MPKKEKIKELLGRLNSIENGVLPSTETKSLISDIINKEYVDTTNKIKESSTFKILDVINNKLDTFKTDFDLRPISQTMDDFQSELQAIKDEVSTEFEDVKASTEGRISEIDDAIKKLESTVGTVTDKKTSSILSTLKSLQNEFSSSLKSNAEKESTLNKLISNIQGSVDNLSGNLKNSDTKNTTSLKSSIKDSSKALTDSFEVQLKKLKIELLGKLANIGGGAMNRKVNFGGVDYLTRYTDINYKAGSNVTFTVVNNSTTKMVDVTIAATGGSGGTVRSINSISAPTTAGSTSGTDYVYLVTGTTTLTMPTAVANTNLYTIKNVGTSTVTIAFAGAETADGSTTIVMPIQYTAVDLISDTANWNVT